MSFWLYLPQVPRYCLMKSWIGMFISSPDCLLIFVGTRFLISGVCLLSFLLMSAVVRLGGAMEFIFISSDTWELPIFEMSWLFRGSPLSRPYFWCSLNTSYWPLGDLALVISSCYEAFEPWREEGSSGKFCIALSNRGPVSSLLRP